MKKYIIAAVAVFIVVLVAIAILQKNNDVPPTPTKQPDQTDLYIPVDTYRIPSAETITDPQKAIPPKNAAIRTLTDAESEALRALTNTAKSGYITTFDFELGYSQLLHKLVIYFRSADGSIAFEQYLLEQDYQALLTIPPEYKIIVFAREPLITAIPTLEEQVRAQQQKRLEQL